MSGKPFCIVDTNVLLNLATPVVDTREFAPSGADPLKTLLVAYDVHTPNSVLGELSAATDSDDLLSAAAELVLRSTRHVTTHDVATQLDDPLGYGLDTGEADCIWLANKHDADLCITDEFNSTNYLLVSLALEDRNSLFTTPHILCKLATQGILPAAYVETALGYYVETKQWDTQYIGQLRQQYLVEREA